MGSRVYVGGICYETRERDLESFFKGFGRIKDILIKNGYGFVEFDDYRDAEDAVYELNGRKLLGMRVSVEMARGKPRGRDQEWFSRTDNRPRAGGRGPPIRTNYRIFVKNLSSSVSWQDLKDHLRQAGEVTFADAHKKYKNEGIVEFASYEDMKNVVKKFDDTVLNGRRIRLLEDKGARRSRTRSRSRSKIRSRSRSHSRSASRSRSGSRKSKSRSASRSKSRSPDQKQKGKRSRSPDHSNSKRKMAKRSHSRSASRGSLSKSRSNSRDRGSRSRSRSGGSVSRSAD